MTREDFENICELATLYFSIIYKDQVLSKVICPQHARLGNILIWTHTLFMPMCCIIVNEQGDVIDGYWCSGDYEYNDKPVKDYGQVTKYENI